MSRTRELGFVTFLTLVRFPLVLIFFAAALVHAVGGPSWLFPAALAALILAALTDMFDGYFARKFNVQTRFGAQADPLMDKFFYLGTMPLLVFVSANSGHTAHAVILLLLTLFFLMRDQWVTFLRSIGSMFQADCRAGWWGKLRTSVNFPLICVIYYYEITHCLFPAALIYAAEGAAFVINLVTLLTYTKRYWPYLRKSAEN
ncbi:MAG: CDP-alcohol phosphatidyltransferase family protein [Kiritimatiellia bacterium]